MHINWKRGETRTFVFQREHGRCTHRTHHKGKRRSNRACKQQLNRRMRRETHEALNQEYELTPVFRHQVRWLMA